MKRNGLLTAVFALLLLILGACTSAAEPVVNVSEPDDVVEEPTAVIIPTTIAPVEVNLPDLGEAPEILNDVWINADEPVTLASQRGKVVLLEFWTFG